MHVLWDRPVLLAALAGGLAVLALALGRPAGADEGGGKVREGQPAPDVELPATQVEKALPDRKDAERLHLKDLQGKKNVVLYFFPKALTGG